MTNDDATSANNSVPDLDIPADFEMGVATSAWQIEGDLAGRGRCNWDDFADTPGKIADGDATIEEVGREIFDYMLDIASGKQSKSEALGFGDNEFIPWQVGAVM